jgi:hypothetical protein
MQESEFIPEVGPQVYGKYDPDIPVPDAMPSCPCPRCVNSNYLDRVESVLLNMPAAGYRDLRELMLKPLLTAFCEFNHCMFPFSWVDGVPPEPAPNNPIRRIFHHMCVCVHAHAQVEGNEADDVVRSVQCWGDDLVSWLMRRRRKGGEAGTRERLQLLRITASLHELIGVDVLYRRLYIQISRMMRGEQVIVTPAVMSEYAFSLGREDHAACVARMFYEWHQTRRQAQTQVGHRIVNYTGSLLWTIRVRLLREIDKRTAMAMALHSRLGAESGLLELGVDVLPMCVPKGVLSVPTWRDVMGKWIGEDMDEDSS